MNDWRLLFSSLVFRVCWVLVYCVGLDVCCFWVGFGFRFSLGFVCVVFVVFVVVDDLMCC